MPPTAEQSQQQSQHTATTQHTSAFPRPMLALHQGRSVKILAFGDVPGKSPSYLFVDENGRTEWDSIANFIVCDPNLLPPSTENLRRILSNTSGSSR